jgi:hypothetical protein
LASLGLDFLTIPPPGRIFSDPCLKLLTALGFISPPLSFLSFPGLWLGAAFGTGKFSPGLFSRLTAFALGTPLGIFLTPTCAFAPTFQAYLVGARF